MKSTHCSGRWRSEFTTGSASASVHPYAWNTAITS